MNIEINVCGSVCWEILYTVVFRKASNNWGFGAVMSYELPS